MLFAARIARQARPITTLRSSASIIRPFSQAQQLRLKEDANRSPEELERIKQEQLKQQKVLSKWDGWASDFVTSDAWTEVLYTDVAGK